MNKVSGNLYLHRYILFKEETDQNASGLAGEDADASDSGGEESFIISIDEGGKVESFEKISSTEEVSLAPPPVRESMHQYGQGV